MPERIGFIGLGIMGRPMARNLLRAGYPLVVWNRSRPGIEELVAQGAAEAASPADAARHSDIVATIVGDAPDVEQVALGPGGIIEAARDGLVHIDMTTISPAATRRIGERYAATGQEMLDAPVSGGEEGAINAALCLKLIFCDLRKIDRALVPCNFSPLELAYTSLGVILYSVTRNLGPAFWIYRTVRGDHVKLKTDR